MIPQCDPGAAYRTHQTEIDQAIRRVLESSWYVLGKEVGAFEEKFAAWLGVKHAVGVANGTDAIELALRALGVGPGDKVATVSHTAVATVAGIRRTGADVRFVDIEPAYYTMDPDSLGSLLEQEPDIRAVVVVHLYGQMADMPRILEIARRHGLRVIEDCAQAHGAKLQGRMAGSWGDVGTFSFYPTKNLGALGDGGAVVCNDARIAECLRALRQYGWDEKRVSRMEGVNSRLDELQAAVLGAKMANLNDDNEARKRIAERYLERLAELDRIQLPMIRQGAEPVWHQFVIRCRDRDSLAAYLKARDVATAVHYPRAAHQMPAYARPEWLPVPLSNTEQAASRILSLPMFPQLSVTQVDQVIEAIKDWQ
ncbi:MAG: DegT/DnrJ/EryC1/StrS family aminotransferase [Nitrospirae bacterium]|nr:MAG: DegT/DnrJ/EryC1/StrS family aminotransferase [Nitrospirota bacterium]